MQLKEFSLISPVVESGAVLKALETAIPTVAIEQAISQTKGSEQRKRAIPIKSGDLSAHRHELMVQGINDKSPEKSCRWFE